MCVFKISDVQNVLYPKLTKYKCFLYAYKVLPALHSCADKFFSCWKLHEKATKVNKNHKNWDKNIYY